MRPFSAQASACSPYSNTSVLPLPSMPVGLSNPVEPQKESLPVPSAALLFAGLLRRTSPSRQLSELVNKTPGIHYLLDGLSKEERQSMLNGLLGAKPDTLQEDAKVIQELVKPDIPFDPTLYGQAIADMVEKGRVDIVGILLEHAKYYASLDAASTPALRNAILFRPPKKLPLEDILTLKEVMLDRLLSAGLNPTKQEDELLNLAIAASGKLKSYLGNDRPDRHRKDGVSEHEADAKAEETIRRAFLFNRHDSLPMEWMVAPLLPRLASGIKDWHNVKQHYLELDLPMMDPLISRSIVRYRKQEPWSLAEYL